MSATTAAPKKKSNTNKTLKKIEPKKAAKGEIIRERPVGSRPIFGKYLTQSRREG